MSGQTTRWSYIDRAMPMPFFVALGFSAAMLLSIAVANALFDRGVPQYLTRKIAHVAAGLAFTIAPFVFLDAVLPLLLAAGFTLLMTGGRQFAPRLIRGVGGTGRKEAIAEIWYPVACATSIAIGWLWLGNPWLGVLPTLFLGFGDAVTGIVRSAVYGREVKGWAGTIAMLIVCSALAIVVRPIWIGMAGAVTATWLERATPASKYWDDNPALTIGSAVVMGALYRSFAM